MIYIAVFDQKKYANIVDIAESHINIFKVHI